MTGLTKFTEAERQDDRWRLREALILQYVERSMVHELNQLVFLQDVAAAQYVAGNDTFSYYHKRAGNLYKLIAGKLQTYMDYGSADADVAQNWLANAKNLWAQVWGDPDDPEKWWNKGEVPEAWKESMTDDERDESGRVGGSAVGRLTARGREGS